jgi:hypothetical protein
LTNGRKSYGDRGNPVLLWPKLFEGRVYIGAFSIYNSVDDGTGDGTECDGDGDGLGNGNWGAGGGSIKHYYRARYDGGK